MNEEDKKKKGEGQDGKEGEGQESPGTDPKKTGEGTSEGQPQPVPYERFKEVNERAKTAEARLAKLEKAEADRIAAEDANRQQKLKEQQQFQSLAEEWEGKFGDLEPKFKNLEAEHQRAMEVLTGYADSQMERVPEVFRGVVSAMPVLERLEWLTENSSKLEEVNGAGPKGIPSSPKGRTPSEMTDEQRRKLSARTF